MKYKIIQFFLALTVGLALVNSGCVTGDSEEKTPTSATSPTGGASAN